ncbi:hypothetical protein DFH09DRAFT_1307549 [Mycena vulgaris]|nr:hypothetical protein DFH09DRAFT_1307549 [Mycena vulgaris]
MPAAALQRCTDDEECQDRRCGSYRKYRRTHLDECCKKGQIRMAASHARESTEARAARLERHRETQRKYRERFREQIAHRAWQAAVQKNAAAGKATNLRPKARQYWSNPELASGSDEEEDDNW